jgi:hypothetical protein
VGVDLTNWRHLLGGEIEPETPAPGSGPYSFDLPDGTYQIRAIYEGFESEIGTCAPVSGPVYSEWVPFEVKMDGGV